MFDSWGLVVGLPMYSIGTLAVDMVTIDMVVVVDSIVVVGKIVFVDRVIVVEVVVVG